MMAVKGVDQSSITFFYDRARRCYVCKDCSLSGESVLPSDERGDRAFTHPLIGRLHLADHERSGGVVPRDTILCIEGDAQHWTEGGATNMEGDHS